MEAGGVDTAFLLCLPSRFHSFDLRCKALNSIQLTLAEWSRMCVRLTKPSVRPVVPAVNESAALRQHSGGARVAGECPHALVLVVIWCDLHHCLGGFS